MGMGPLLAWRKTSPEMFKRGLRRARRGRLVVAILHVAGRHVAALSGLRHARPHLRRLRRNAPAKARHACCPWSRPFLCAFNVAVVVQEYARGIRGAPTRRQRVVRHRARQPRRQSAAPLRRLHRSPRHRLHVPRLHRAIVGRRQRSLAQAGRDVPGRPLRDAATSARAWRSTRPSGWSSPISRSPTRPPVRWSARPTPAKFIYRKMPESPTTEVSMLHSIRDDLYVVVGVVSPETKVATFQVHVNPLVSWIWIGVLILIFGAVVSMWPEVAVQEAKAWSYMRMAGGLTSTIIFGVMLALAPGRAFAQSSSLHAGIGRNDRPHRARALRQLALHVRRLRSLAVVHLHVQHRRRDPQRNPLQAARRARPSTPSEPTT